jgi:hypothetical protein
VTAGCLHTLFAATMTQNAAMYQVGPAAYYSIDVECVATGTDHHSRAVGQIALVDQYEQVGEQAAEAAAQQHLVLTVHACSAKNRNDLVLCMFVLGLLAACLLHLPCMDAVQPG